MHSYVIVLLVLFVEYAFPVRVQICTPFGSVSVLPDVVCMSSVECYWSILSKIGGSVVMIL